MKIATKIFLILSIVAGSIYSLVGFIYAILGGVLLTPTLAAQDPESKIVGAVFTAIGLVVLVIGVVVIIICATTLRKLSKAKCASDISTARKIVVLIFGNLVAGILLLCMKDKDFADQKDASSLDEIAKLKGLLDMGAITQEEFEAKKKEYLDLKPQTASSAMEPVTFKLED